ncbi:MAG: U32 family peptidase [Clostridia bacterium]|nr:U32 family peptidase [Clostridia bacterium]
MKNKPEILAPAGSFECVLSAVRTGADAVYLGTKNFNARKGAENFGRDELKKTIEYCRARGVRVHIALNTLVSDEEFDAALSVVKEVSSLGADALILQDLGLSRYAKMCSPDLERHASTQMSVQTAAGLELLKELGFSRAVLPRELSKKEIEDLRNSTDLELEVFVHGALCMCVSGQCYMSAMLGSRSGNRGLCAQPCRLPFSAAEPGRHDLSLKDLSLIDELPTLSEIGINSFKIEGRMKRPEYVAAAVTSAKETLSGELHSETQEKLSAVFSRSGFTKGYFENRLGSEMFGTRRREDVVSASSKVLSSLKNLYSKETPRVGVSLFLSVIENEPISLSAKANGKTVFLSSETSAEKALNKPISKELLSSWLSKCGSTPFYPEEIEIELDEGVTVSAGAINKLRREALERLEKELSSVKSKHFTDINFKLVPHVAKEAKKFRLVLSKGDQIPENLSDVENIYFPLNVEEKYVESVKNKGITLGIEIPHALFGVQSEVEKLLERVKSFGITNALCPTLDAVALALRHGFNVDGGFSLNVFNSRSLAVFEELNVKSVTLSPELTLGQIEKIGGSVQRGIVAYGRLPLMLVRNCPIKNVKTCAECKGKSFLTDRMGIRFPVACKGYYREILNSRAIYMGDRLDEIKNTDFLLFLFTREKRENVDAVLEAYRKGKKAKGDFTRGLYYRGVE